MPYRPTTASILAVAAFNLLLWGLTLSGGAVALQRRFGSRWVWSAWFVVVVVFTMAGTIFLQRMLPGGIPVLTTAYMTGVVIAVPSAMIAVVSTRVGQRDLQPRWQSHLLRTFLAFLVSLPPAFVLAALPDIAALF